MCDFVVVVVVAIIVIIIITIIHHWFDYIVMCILCSVTLCLHEQNISMKNEQKTAATTPTKIVFSRIVFFFTSLKTEFQYSEVEKVICSKWTFLFWFLFRSPIERSMFVCVKTEFVSFKRMYLIHVYRSCK